MEQDEDPVDIPLSHSTIRQNDVFLDQLVRKLRSGEWTENDLRLFLEGYAYRTETINRFVRAAKIRLEHPTKSPSGEPKPRKPKRSEGAMTPDEVEKIKDPEARRIAKEYLDDTEPPAGEANTTSSTSAVGSTTKGTNTAANGDKTVRKGKRRK